MMKPLTEEQEEFLKDLYYKRHFVWGRDKLYKYVSTNHSEEKLTRRQIAHWLSNQETQQLFRQKPERKDARPLVTARKTLQVDLMDMALYSASNNRYKYILSCIDIESRKIFAFKLLTKTASAVKAHVLPILTRYNYKVLSTDNGTEFQFKVENIQHIFGNPYTPQNQSIIESSNKTIKTAIFKVFHIRKNKRWIDILDDIVAAYNNTAHRTIGNRTPNEVFNGNAEMKRELKQQNIERIRKSQKYSEDKLLTIGQLVRLVRQKPKQSKDEPSYSVQVYTIYSIVKPKDNSLSRTRYKIMNESGVVLKGNYNITQLQVIDQVETSPVLTETNQDGPLLGKRRRRDLDDISNRFREPKSPRRLEPSAERKRKRNNIDDIDTSKPPKSPRRLEPSAERKRKRNRELDNITNRFREPKNPRRRM